MPCVFVNREKCNLLGVRGDISYYYLTYILSLYYFYVTTILNLSGCEFKRTLSRDFILFFFLHQTTSPCPNRFYDYAQFHCTHSLTTHGFFVRTVQLWAHTITHRFTAHTCRLAQFHYKNSLITYCCIDYTLWLRTVSPHVHALSAQFHCVWSMTMHNFTACFLVTSHSINARTSRSMHNYSTFFSGPCGKSWIPAWVMPNAAPQPVGGGFFRYPLVVVCGACSLCGSFTWPF